MKSVIARQRAAHILRLKKLVTDQRSRAEGYFQEAQGFLERMAQAQRELEAFDASESKSGITAQVEKILSNPFYKLKATSGNLIEFITEPIFMHHKDTNQGIDMKVNFGKFTVIWAVENNSFKVRAGEGNTLVDGYIHPHVSSDGDVCLGNAGSAFTQAIQAQEFYKVFEIFQAIFHSYNSGSPFKRLDQWFVRQNKAELAKKDHTYQCKGHVWVRDEEIDNLEFSPKILASTDYENEEGDIEGETHKVSVYMKISTQYGVEIDDDIFMISGNNRYFQVQDRDFANEINWY